MATAMMSMTAIDVVAVHLARGLRGQHGNSIMMEDDDKDAEAGEEVMLH
jgi:hypothetical protein